MDGAGAGDGLEGCCLYKRMEVSIFSRNGVGSCVGKVAYPSFFDGGALWTEDEFLGGRGKLSETCYGEVFVVEVRIIP
jgi:hypothetical protein